MYLIIICFAYNLKTTYEDIMYSAEKINKQNIINITNAKVGCTKETDIKLEELLQKSKKLEEEIKDIIKERKVNKQRDLSTITTSLKEIVEKIYLILNPNTKQEILFYKRK